MSKPIKTAQQTGRGSARFASPREAIAYLVAHHRGPQRSRMRWTDAPRSTGHTPWDASEIAALLYGPADKGFCGVVRGSALDLELQDWATIRGYPRRDRVRSVERRLRALMRKYGLKRERVTLRAMVRHVFTDAYTGKQVDTLVESESTEPT